MCWCSIGERRKKAATAEARNEKKNRKQEKCGCNLVRRQCRYERLTFLLVVYKVNTTLTDDVKRPYQCSECKILSLKWF